jgi:hypothetical protein
LVTVIVGMSARHAILQAWYPIHVIPATTATRLLHDIVRRSLVILIIVYDVMLMVRVVTDFLRFQAINN